MDGPDKVPRVSSNWSFNWPTLLMLVGMTGAGVSWGVTTYNDVDHRISGNTRDVLQLQRDVNRVDNQVGQLGRDQNTKVDALRTEMRGDLRDINDKLDQLLLGRQGSSRKDLNGWTR